MTLGALGLGAIESLGVISLGTGLIFLVFDSHGCGN